MTKGTSQAVRSRNFKERSNLTHSDLLEACNGVTSSCHLILGRPVTTGYCHVLSVTARFCRSLPGETISKNLGISCDLQLSVVIRTAILQHAIDIYSSNCIPSYYLYCCFSSTL
eukprot:1376990-Amorphochlora_amoeboformis.AAC.1